MGRANRPRLRMTLSDEKELKVFKQLAEELGVTPAQFILDASVGFVNVKLADYNRLKAASQSGDTEVKDERAEVITSGADSESGPE